MQANVRVLGSGTSQGVPVIGCMCKVCNSLDYRDKRLRSSILLEAGDTRILIDTSPDFRTQALRHRIHRVDAILFTHEHKDHTGGLDDIRPINFLMGGEMPLYGWPRVLDRIKRDYHYSFAAERYPGVPSFQLNEFIDHEISIAGIPFRTFEVMHAKLPVLAFVVGNFCYITDANYIDAKYLDAITGIDVLIINALQIEPHISHFTLAEALAIIDRVKPKRAILTHISHNLGTHFERSKELPAGVELAYDGMYLDIAI